MPSATAAAIPLARLLVADSEPLKQTFSGAGSTREDLRSVLPMYIEVKGWKDIDGSSIESLISCLFDGKVLGGSNLTWAEFNIGLREIELEDPQQAADEDDDNEASTGQPEVDEAIAEREPSAAKLPEAGATAQLEVAYLTTATSKLQKMVSAVKNSCSARHHSAAAVQASAPSAKPQQTEAEFLREMTARINHMASRQRTVLARVQDGASPSSTTVAKSLANALSSDGGRDALKAIFDSLDANGDGRISKREWGKGIRKHELSLTKYFGISLKGIGQKFSEMDADGSQDLSFEEFASGAMSLNAAIRISEAMGNESGLAEFEQLFNALDKDGNGKVSKKEWQTGIFKNKKLLAKHFGGASLGEIGAAFARIDENGDLSLSFEEFRSGARSLAAAVKISDSLATPQGHAELRELFKRLDKNGDGRISKREWGQSIAANRVLLQKYFGSELKGSGREGDLDSPPTSSLELHDLKEIGKAFKRLDADGSGDLTWEEFKNGAAAVSDVWWSPL